jgi:hypothetical protein
MVSSSSVSSSSDNDGAAPSPSVDAPVYRSSNLAASLAGLPVRVPGQQDGLEGTNGTSKPEQKGLTDTLDLAVSLFFRFFLAS